MANYQKMQEVSTGYISFYKHLQPNSFPSQCYATPGIFAKPLYSRYVPLNDSGFDGNCPFRSEKTLQGTIEHQGKELTYSKLDSVKNEVPEQIGHGQESEMDKPPSPYNETKMKEVLEK